MRKILLIAAACLGFCNLRAQPAPSSVDEQFPLHIVITSIIGGDFVASGSIQSAYMLGMSPPVFASTTLWGTINGEDHWVLTCRPENPLREANPCTGLAVGEYRGRWIHDFNTIELLGGAVDAPFVRFLNVSYNVKSPPVTNDPMFQSSLFDLTVPMPSSKSYKDYPVLVHVYGGYALEVPVGQLPARTNCTAYTPSSYQSSVSCASYPAIDIHRGYVTLEIGAETVSYATLTCWAKWRWSHCALVDPGFYYARRDGNKLVLLTYDKAGKPREVGFAVK